MKESKHFNWCLLRVTPLIQNCQPEQIKTLTLEQCFNDFSTVQTLDEYNQWYCPHCKNFVNAKKKMDIWDLPECLIIHLKRFSLNGWGFTKLNSIVEYPDEIDLSNFIIGPQKNNPLIYNLYGICEHHGGMGGGHYTSKTIVKGTGKWFSFNDSFVKETTTNSAHNENAYVLFYIKKKIDI